MRKSILGSITSLLVPFAAYGANISYGAYQRRQSMYIGTHQPLPLANGQRHSFVERTFDLSAAELDLSAGTGATELVIIDAAAPNKHILYRAIKPGVDIVEIASTGPGLEQLTAMLARYKNLSALHIVSHALDGELLLGNSRITAENIKHEIEAFAALNGALRDGGDLLLYGCDLAAGDAGTEMLEIIHGNTHLDVAASSDKTGARDLTGDWELEISAGNIETELPFSDKALKDFSAVLAAPNGTYDFSGFTDGGATLTSTDFTVSAKDSSGAPSLPVSIYGSSIAFIDSGAVSVSNYFYVTADGVDTGSFELTGLAAAEYYTGEINFTNVRIVGIRPDNSQITSAELDGNLATGDEDFIFGAGQLSNFAGVQLKAFKLYFDVTTRTAAGGGGGPFVGDASLFDFSSFTIANAQNPANNDATLTAAGGVTEPVGLATTVDTVGEAVNVFDFTIADGGGGDGLSTLVSQIVVNVSGTSTDAQRGQVTWRLNGPDVSNVTGTYNAGADTITFTGLSINVAHGGNETYTVNAYYNDNTGLIEDRTFVLSVDGDTNLTVGASGTQMGSTSAVTNGTGSTVDVAATQLVFTTQPAGSVSGAALTTQPVVAARDAFGNTDVDFTETISLTEASAGTLSNNTQAATAGVATFTNLIYTATADQQGFTLTANDQDGVGSDLPTVNANAVTSDVVATRLVFTTQPSPTSVTSGQATVFSTVPVVSAQDANSIVDAGYATGITLSEVNGAGSATMTGTGDTDGSGATVSITPSSGVSTFTGMQITYTNSGVGSETFNLRASSGGLTTADSSQLTSTSNPTVTSVSTITADGTYKIGDTVTVVVNFSEAVFLSTGTIQLTLETGTTDRVLSYLAGSGSATLYFSYTVQAGDTSADLDYTNTTALAANGDTIQSGSFIDAILTLPTPGAAGSLGNAANLVVDGVRPTASIVVADTTLTASETSTVTITFSEAITGLAIGDFTVANGALSSLSSGDGGITWTATLTPTASIEDPTNLITLNNTGVADAAGNTGAGTTDSNNYAIDALRPTASIVVADTALAAGETTTVTITFSEAITGLAIGDFTVANGALSSLSSGDGGITWTATLTPTAGITDATNVITLANTGVQDAAGNAGTGTTDSNNYAIDTARPTASVVVADTALATGETSLVTITFSEAVTGFTNADLTIANGNLSAVSSGDGGITWTATLTPSGTSASNVITLDNTGYVDAAGNTGTGTTDSNSYSVDTDAPVNSLPAAQITDSVTQLVFSSGNGNAISVADNGSLTVVIAIGSGTLTASTGGTAGISNNGTGSVTITGTAAEVNVALEGLTYAPNGAGAQTFTIQSTDATGNVDSDNLDITVNNATLLVTSNLDTGDDETAAGSFAADQADGSGLSIREALNWARAGDTITFDLDSGTAGNQGGSITLNANQLVVAYSNLAIDGDLDDDGSADVTISANNASRVMSVNGSLSGIVLSGLTLTQGNSIGGGGGLALGSSVSITVRDSNITNNTISGTGGAGIYGNGVTLTVINSTVSGNNSDSFGGGMRVVGASVLNLINSTISGNTTTGASQHGGGIQYAGSTLTIINSTISGNAVTGANADGGGLRITSGTSYIYNTTIVGNAATNLGGGVSANGTTDNFINTVVAGNTAGAGTAAGAGGSPLATGGADNDAGGTIEVATNSFFGTTATITTDNSSLNNQGTSNLLLGNLGNYNGSPIQTHRPQSGSALLEAGSNLALPPDTYDLDGDSNIVEALPVDANGDVRVSGTVDIGAVEGAPAINSISVPANGTYTTGQHLDFTVNTAVNITVDTTGGTPRLALTVGAITRYAAYLSGSGTTAVVYRYTVQAGDNDSDGIAVDALETNGGTLRDALGNDLSTTLNSVGNTSSVLVDAAAPTVNSVSVPANATYVAGQHLDFTVNASENVTVNTTGGTPRIALTIGATTRFATYLSGSGTSAIVFRHTVQAGDSDANGIAVAANVDANGGTLRDAAGNDLNAMLNSVGSTASVLIDAVAPTVNSVNVPANDTYTAGENLSFTVNTSENITVNTSGGTPRIALTIGATTRDAMYLSGTGTSAIVFRYTVQTGDDDNDGVTVAAAIDPNGGTLRDNIGNNLSATLNSVGSTANVRVDALAPNAPSTPDLAASSDRGTSSTDNLTGDATPTLTGTAEANSTVTVSNQNGVLGSTTADGSGNWNYTPGTALADGVHNFTATATDASGNISVASAALAVTIDTAAPTVAADAATVDEDHSVAINVLANDSAVASGFNAASVRVVTAPTNGRTSVHTGTGLITYTPNTDYNGVDTFTYVVENLQQTASAPATVTITVNALNDAPDVIGDTASTGENTSVLIDVANNDSDRDTGDSVAPATIRIVSGPVNGAAVLESGRVRYTPANGYTGADQFAYTIDDQSGATSAPANVSVNVGVDNAAPTAANDAANTNEDAAVVINVLANDSDSDGTLDATTVSVLTSPENGAASVSVLTGVITYTPDADFNGVDTFTYVVHDNGNATSNAATVTVTVAALNDAPVANADVATIAHDVAYTINVLGNDRDIDGTLVPASVQVVTAAAHGSTSVNTTTGAITYTPVAPFGGADSFTYQVQDNTGAWSPVATVTLTSQSANHPPIANDDTVSTNEDAAAQVQVLANDSDPGGALSPGTVTIVNTPASGIALVNFDGTVAYTPAANWTGTVSFTYTVADTIGAVSNVATATVTVRALNDAPTISGTPATSVNEGQAYSFTPTIADTDGQRLTVTAANLPAWLTLNATTGALTGTPTRNDVGTHGGIILSVSDGAASNSLAAFAIEVAAVTDRDGDGMPDEFEQTHGFDPLNPNDATTDLDGDGVSNLDEYLAVTNPTVDDYPPLLSSPAPISIDATGLLTALPTLTPPTATDTRDGALMAALIAAPTHVAPGVHILTWRARDVAGNTAETLQALNVRPLIALAPNQTTSEGATVQVRFLLNGESPTYPVSVNYTVGGTANAGDHNLTAGVVTFENGELEKSLPVQIVQDNVAEGTETIDIALSGTGNFGTPSRHVIQIVERNVAPRVRLSVQQSGREARVIAQDAGPVTVTATVSDANVGDTHVYQWSFPAGAVASGGDSIKTFDPAVLTQGVHAIRLTVRDNGSPVESATTAQQLRIVAAQPVLSAAADSDGDGIDDTTEGTGDIDGDGVPDYLDVSVLPNVLNENAADGTAFQLEADPGLTLTLGNLALQHGSDGAQVAIVELAASGVPADTIPNVGGYFDLIIGNLPARGAAVNVVIPQRQAVPANPLYRKFINGQWNTFIEDANNRLASATGSAGVCPPPGNNAYRAGLNPGDWCVQLTLQDGGPNDADGVADATVVDPGGVGDVPVVVTGTRGGGAMGIPAMLTLVLFAMFTMALRLWRRPGARRVLPTLLLAVVVAPMDVRADERPWWNKLYVSGVLGHAETNLSERDVEREFASQGIAATVNSTDGSRFTWGLNVGYPVANRWSVEAGYLDLGETAVEFSALSTATQIAHIHPDSGSGMVVAGLYRWPIGQRFDVGARMGAFAWDAEYEAVSGGQRVDAFDDSGVDLIWGLSAGYRLTDMWTVNLDAQRVEFSEPTHLFGVSLQWKFRP